MDYTYWVLKQFEGGENPPPIALNVNYFTSTSAPASTN